MTPEEEQRDATPQDPQSESEGQEDSSAEQKEEAPEPSQQVESTEPETQTWAPGWYADPNQQGQQRYWDGKEWTQQVQSVADTQTAPVGMSTERKTPEERKAMLAQQVQSLTVQGLRVESQSDFQAVLIAGAPINHTVHAIVTIFSCGLWGIVWIVLALTGGEKREMVAVDQFGNVQHQRLGKV